MKQKNTFSVIFIFTHDTQMMYKGTVLPAKSGSDVMFCLQNYQGLEIDRSLVY